jgi:serine/threonine-protein phosphatase Stp1
MNLEFRIEDGAASHEGQVRSVNEDRHACLRGAGIWVVADGMGGHHDGQFASQQIVDTLGEAYAPDGLEIACEAVSAAIHRANAVIYDRACEIGQQIGSTVVTLVVRAGEFAVLWAGDSRAYLYRDSELIRLTRDHSQVEDLLEQGRIGEDEIASHPLRHVLLRAVGVEQTLQIDAIRDFVEPGDLFLLCSDGLHGVLADSEIAGVLRDAGAGASGQLVQRCLERGAPDNVTVALVGVHAAECLASGAGIQ